MQISFSGVLSAADIKRHIDHPFDLPEGVTALSIDFVYSPPRTPSGINLLTLTVFDANGWRGEGHRHAVVVDDSGAHHVQISAAQATPGYLPGPLPAGRWNVVINTHSILPDAPVSYSIEVTGASGAVATHTPTPVQEKPIATAKQRPGWYRGDLHAHTLHSDATWDVAAFAAFMRARGLDFATLSDHNTISGLAEWDQLTTPDFLTIGAVELTTFYGHCLAWGARDPQDVDWRIRPGVRDMADIAAKVTARGALFGIAHPTAIGDPVCTGCKWVYPEMQPGSARLVEIWNTSWEGESNNDVALHLWYAWLNQGYRMVATAGTDIHGPYVEPANTHELGFNVVYAERLTEPAILHAIQRGHLYISGGPALELTALGVLGATAMMGGSLPSGAAQVIATWDRCVGDEHLILIADGMSTVEIASIGTNGRETWSFFAGQAHWCTVEIRDSRNHLRAVANPIFFER